MSDNFFYRKIFHIKRHNADGSVDEFSANGMARMKSVLDQKNGNIPKKEVLFIFDPDAEIMLGDIVSFDDWCCKIGKVEPIFDLNGKLQAYRVESI